MRSIHELCHLENPSYTYEEIIEIIYANPIDGIYKTYLITLYKDYIEILKQFPKYINYTDKLNVDELIYLITKCQLNYSWLNLGQIKLLLKSLPKDEYIKLIGSYHPLLKNNDILKNYYAYYYYYIDNLDTNHSKHINYQIFLLENNYSDFIQQKPCAKDIISYNLYNYFPEIKINETDILNTFCYSFNFTTGRRPYVPSISEKVMETLKDSVYVIYYILSSNLSPKEKSELILKYYTDISTLSYYLYCYYLNIESDFDEYLEIKKFISSQNYSSFYRHKRQLYSLNPKFTSLKSFLEICALD